MRKLLFYTVAFVAMVGCAKIEQPDSYVIEGDVIKLTSAGRTNDVDLSFFSLATNILTFYEEISSKDGVMSAKKSFEEPLFVRNSAYMYHGSFEIRRVEYHTAYKIWILSNSEGLCERNLPFYYTVTEVYLKGEKIAESSVKFIAGDMTLTPLRRSEKDSSVYDFWQFSFPICAYSSSTGETLKEFNLVLQTQLTFD